MDRQEIRRQLDAILDKHNEAFRALRQARDSSRGMEATIQPGDRGFDAAIAGLRTAVEGLAVASEAWRAMSEHHHHLNDAQDRAIDAALDANTAVLGLLRQLDASA